MNLNETLDFFKKRLEKSTKKSEIKIDTKFVTVLTNLKERALTKKDYELIDIQLNNLNFDDHSKKNLRKQLRTFLKYLKEKFALVSEGYYTELGMALGITFGAALGSVWEIGMTISFGMLFGLIVGKYMDSEAEKLNKVLKAKMK